MPLTHDDFMLATIPQPSEAMQPATPSHSLTSEEFFGGQPPEAPLPPGPTGMSAAFESFVVGLNRTNAAAARLPAVAYNVAAIPQNVADRVDVGTAMALGPLTAVPGLIKQVTGRSVSTTAPDWLRNNPIATYFDRGAEAQTYRQRTYGDEDWLGAMRRGDYHAAGDNLFHAVLENAPNTLMMIGSSLAGLPAPAIAAAAGGLSGAETLQQARAKRVGALEETVGTLTNAGFEAVWESAGTLGLMQWGRDLFREVGPKAGKAILAQVSKGIARGFVQEGSEEFGTQLSQDWANKILGIEDVPWRDMPRRAVVAFGIGGASGATMTGPGAIAAGAQQAAVNSHQTRLNAALTALDTRAASEPPIETKLIHEAVASQLVAAGVAPQDAGTYAQLYESAFSTLGQRAGIAPTDLFARYGLTIRKTDQAAAEGLTQENAPLFFSKLEATIEQKLPNAMSSEQALNTLVGAGVKQEELDWIDVQGFLKDKPKVTKLELIDYVRSNNVQVQEVVKGGPPQITNAKARRVQGAGENAWSVFADEFPEGLDVTAETAGQAIQAAWVKAEKSKTKFSQYQLPGGTQYKELLLTLPVQETPLPSDVDIQHTPDTGYGEGWHVISRSLNMMASGATKEEALQKFRVEVLHEDKPGFRSSHFDEPNVLAHVRFNDRVDVNGKKTLFIEEVQSDWHQKGRKEGYASGKPPTDLTITKTINDRGNPQYIGNWNDGGRAVGPYGTEEAVRVAAAREAGGVPNAPFKKTWHELALKRMLRYAVDRGYEQIAWTTGAQQAERYDLSKQVDRVTALKKPSGNFEIFIYKGEGRTPIGNYDVGPEKLPDIVGKDLAAKIVNQENYEHNYAGVDLQVGGEGMKGFYDQIVPSFLNKYTKKWGGRVGETSIATPSKLDVHVYEGPSYTVEDLQSALKEANKGGRDIHISPLTGRHTQYAVNRVDVSVALKDIINAMSAGAPFQDAVNETGQQAAEVLGGKYVPAPVDTHTKSTVHALTLTPEMQAALGQAQPLFQSAQHTPLFNKENIDWFDAEHLPQLQRMDTDAIEERMDNALEPLFRQNMTKDEAWDYFVDHSPQTNTKLFEAARQNRLLTALGDFDVVSKDATWHDVPTMITVYRGSQTGALDKKPGYENFSFDRQVATEFAGAQGVVKEYLVHKNDIEWVNQGYLGHYEGEVIVQTNRVVDASLKQTGAAGPRGMLRFGPEKQINIDLLPTADLSTFLHETGHFYLEVLKDLASIQESSPDIQEDYAIIRQWLGVPEGGEIMPEQHEQFARGFEAYLREGQAPSSALQQVFKHFQEWLLHIYQTLTNLNVELTDDVRGVFDRMLATQAEIAEAQAHPETVIGPAVVKLLDGEPLTEVERAAVPLLSDIEAQVAALRASAAAPPAVPVDTAVAAVEPSDPFVSRVFARLQAEHPELEGTLTYTPIILLEETEKAVNLLAADKQRLFRIAMNAEPSSELTSTAANIVLAERALDEGNAALFNRLVVNRSLAQTRRGQELAAERGSITNNSTSRYVQELLAARLDTLGKTYLGDVSLTKQVTSKQRGIKKLAEETTKVEQQIKRKALDVKSALALLDQMACL